MVAFIYKFCVHIVRSDDETEKPKVFPATLVFRMVNKEILSETSWKAMTSTQDCAA